MAPNMVQSRNNDSNEKVRLINLDLIDDGYFSTHHHILPTLLTPNITSHTHGPRWEHSRLLGLLIEGGIRFATVNNAGHRATSDSIRSNLVLRSLDTVSDGGIVAVIYHTGKFGESRDKQVLICMARLRISSYE
jgi:hypothetical protein